MKLNFLITALLSFTLISMAHAQKITVKKTKGKNAIVESTIPLTEGEVYDLQTSPIAENVNYQTKGLKSRQNSFMIGGNFVSLRGTDYNKNAGAIQARYGWNFTNLEFGAAAEASTEDLGAGSTTSFLLGGYFDYNLVANRDPRAFIYGPFAFAGFGSVNSPSSKGGGSTSTIEVDGGGFLTWFFANSPVALRLEGFATLQKLNTATKQTDVTGFGTRGFFVYYY